MLSCPRTLPTGFIAPASRPKRHDHPPARCELHEIKHDGFRVIARKDGPRVKLYSRPGNDLTWRFGLIVEPLAGLRSRTCIIDGEAAACDDAGSSSFDRLRHRNYEDCIFLDAFDLKEKNEKSDTQFECRFSIPHSATLELTVRTRHL